MTNNNGNLSNEEHDPEVSSQYRALANESAPKSLDRMVLQSARKAVDNSKSSVWGTSWYRPATFLATLGLSLALLLEITEFQVFDPAADVTFQQETHPDTNVFQGAADNAARSVREVDATADESLQLSNGSTNENDAITTTLPANSATGVQHCSDEQLALPESWWQCIQELREAGLHAAAESELANLHKVFPQYMPAK